MALRRGAAQQGKAQQVARRAFEVRLQPSIHWLALPESFRPRCWRANHGGTGGGLDHNGHRRIVQRYGRAGQRFSQRPGLIHDGENKGQIQSGDFGAIASGIDAGKIGFEESVGNDTALADDSCPLGEGCARP